MFVKKENNNEQNEMNTWACLWMHVETSYAMKLACGCMWKPHMPWNLIEEKSLLQFSVAIIPSFLLSSIKFLKGSMEAMNFRCSIFFGMKVK
jgi:hypothetical protein